jgi:5-formyltetrahydrofolate cyclo-ligase
LQVVNKLEWRRWAKSQPPPTTDEAALVVEGIRAWLARLDKGGVLIYLPIPGEIDLTPLLDIHKLSFFTTRTPVEGPCTIHRLPAPLERHPFGFMQPEASAPTVSPLLIDVALVPGLVFARHGTRIGHGAGYYDMLLPELDSRAHRVGVTLARMVVETLPKTDRDIDMDFLATESGCRRVES